MPKLVPYATCQHCPLFDDKYSIVRHKGPKDAKFIVVGDGPTRDDAFVGRAFASTGGQLLKKTLAANGVDPDQGYYANITLCWTRSILDDKVVLPQAIANCRNHLGMLLCALPDVPVLVVGEFARKAMGLYPEQWGRETLTGKQALATSNTPEQVLAEPGLMFKFTQVVKKFTHPRQQYVYPGTRPCTVDPYPLPNLNEWTNHLICLDIETDNGVKWYDPDNHIFLLGIAIQNQRYIFTRSYLQQPETQAWLRALVRQHGHNIGGHNYKFDALHLHREFGLPLVIGWDTILMVNVLHEYWHKGLKELSTFFFDADDYEHRLVKSQIKTNQSYADVPAAKIKEYLLNDIGYNLDLAHVLRLELRSVDRYVMPYLKHEIPQTNMLAQVEYDGFPVDLAQVKIEQAVMGEDLALVLEQVKRLSGGEITKPGSYKQIRKYLYEVIGRPVKNFTEKGAPSTDEATLVANNDLPAIQALLFWRRVSKLKNSYLDNLEKFVLDGKAHSNYKAFNVVTHRLSASDPAVQTIPNHSVKDSIPPAVLEGIRELHGDVEFTGDYGKKVKRCYVASPGHVLLTMDGKSWEVATACIQSQDKFLQMILVTGASPHNQICEILYGKTYTREEKVKEKNIFFGWMYGGTDSALAYESGQPLEAVQEVTQFLATNLVGLQQWRLRIIETAKQGRVPVPYFNYINHYDLITSQSERDVNKQAVNYVNQGFGSLIMAMTACRTQPHLHPFRSNIVALVHDDFTVQVPTINVVPVAHLMLDTLSEVGQEITDFIPLQGELKIGKNFGDLHSVTIEDLTSGNFSV